MRRVATYRDHRRAVRARRVLEEAGFDAGAVTVEGRDPRRCRVAPPTNLAARTWRWAGRTALVGAVVAAVALAVGAVPWWSVVASGGIGAAAGAVAALTVRAWRNMRRGRHRVVPTAYDVFVGAVGDGDADADRAARVLARWWDTTLRPPARTADGDRLLA